MIITQSIINWNMSIGQDVAPGRYMVMLSNKAIKVATFNPFDGWVDEAGNSLHGNASENFVVMYAGADDIQHKEE